MSADKYGTHDDDQCASLLDNEEDTDTRTHSTFTKESPAVRQEQEIEDNIMVRDQDQQNDEGESSMMSNVNGMDRGKNQMMSILLISIMLVLVSVTFSQSLSPFMIQNYENPSQTSQDILIVYMLGGILLIGAMFLYKDVITEQPNGDNGHVGDNGHDGDNGHGGDNGNVVGGKIKYILRDYLSIVGMSFFFPFACILDLSKIIAAAGCEDIWRLCGDECYREYFVDFFYHLIRILFMAAELAFCCKFHKTQFKESGMVRGGIMIIMAGNLGLWFLSLISEATEQDGHMDGEEKCSYEICHTQSHIKMPENWQTCVNQTSSAHKVMRATIRYLYPFVIEFSLLVGEFLLTKFLSSAERKVGCSGDPTTTERSEGFPPASETTGNGLIVVHQSQRPEENAVGTEQLSTSSDQSDPVYASGHPGLRLGSLLSMFIIGIGLLASFLYTNLAFINSFASAPNKTETDYLNWGSIFDTYAMINYMLINVLIVVGYVCGYGFEIQEKKLHGLDGLVLISVFGPLVYKLINVTAFAVSYTDLPQSVFPAIQISGGLINLMQSILQAPFIFLSERWRLTERQRSQPRYLCQEKILKTVILCLAVANLTYWIYDSIILTHTTPVIDERIKIIFKVENLNIIERITTPLRIFYRFNSFLLFTRVYLGD